MKKLGGLKEKTFPAHGRRVPADEGQKFTQLTKAGRGEQPPEHGKRIGVNDHELSVNQILKDLKNPTHTGAKRGTEQPSEQTKYNANKTLKGV